MRKHLSVSLRAFLPALLRQFLLAPLRQLLLAPSRQILPVTLLVLCSFAASAQNVYKSGLVVNNNGDTLRGFIGYGNWRVNPISVTFKAHEDDVNPVRYDLSTIQYFEITGEDAYRKAIISKDMRPINPEVITGDTEDSVVTDTVFLRMLVSGKKISLYQFMDFKEHYYVQAPGDSIRELAWKFYMRENEGAAQQSGVEELAIYKDQLRKYALDNDDPSLDRQIDRSRYGAQDFTRIVIRINGEGQAKVVGNTNGNRKTRPLFFGSIGVGLSELKASGSGSPLNGLNYKEAVSPVVSVGVDIRSPRNFGDLTLRVEVAYSAYKYTGTGNLSDMFGNMQKETYQVQQKNISPSLSVFYNFRRTRKVKFYIGGGWAYNLSSYSNNSLQIDYSTSSNNTPINDPVDYEKNWQSIFLRLGTRIGEKFELGMTAHVFGSMTDYDAFAIGTKTYTFRALYYF